MEKIINLSDALRAWYENVAKEKNLSWAYLSKKTDISKSYLSKIANGTRANLSYEKAKSLLREICSDRTSNYLYLKEHYPDEVSSMKCYITEECELVLLNDKSKNAWDNKIAFRIFKLAGAGTFNKNFVIDIAGGRSAKIQLNRLLENEIIEIDNGVIKRNIKFKNILNNDIISAISEFRYCLDIIEEKYSESMHDENIKFDSSINKFVGLHKFLKIEAFKELLNELNEFIEHLNTKYSENSKKGEVPIFMNVVTGRFDEK